MASSAPGVRLLLVLFLCAFLFASPSFVAASRRVSLSVYYESLCPYCSDFIVNHLQRIFVDGLISAVDLDLVPFGNAVLDPSGGISCQHGPDECLLNAVEACARHVWPDAQKHFDFIYCVERSVVESQYQWESCFQRAGQESQAVIACYNSGFGGKLVQQYGVRTNSLKPAHQYVPWVVVNGQPIYDDYLNFEKHICGAYGDSLPKACKELPQEMTEEAKLNEGVRACLVNETISYSATREKTKAR